MPSPENSILPHVHFLLTVLTTYNPAALALNDMMKQQIKLSQQFLNMQRDLHRNIMESVEKEHQYTTLEDTKEVIIPLIVPIINGHVGNRSLDSHFVPAMV